MSRKKITSKKKKVLDEVYPGNQKKKEGKKKRKEEEVRGKRPKKENKKIKNGRKRQCTNWAPKKKYNHNNNILDKPVYGQLHMDNFVIIYQIFSLSFLSILERKLFSKTRKKTYPNSTIIFLSPSPNQTLSQKFFHIFSILLKYTLYQTHLKG